MNELEQIRRVLEAGPPLRLAVMFGSRVTGRARPDSDFDIAIVPVDPELSLHDETRISVELSRALHQEVDLVRLDRASALLRWQVAKNGILLLSDPVSEWTRFRAGEASAHADIGENVERYMRLFLRRLRGQTG